MANILIIGESGSGKSYSLRNLDPKTTFIISLDDKGLPFRGWKQSYRPMKGWDDKEGNYYASDDWRAIIKMINHVKANRLDIKTLVIDDFQTIFTNEYMKRGDEKGYGYNVLVALKQMREDLDCIVLSHAELTNDGAWYKVKTIGKLLDEKIGISSKFNYVFRTESVDDQFSFICWADKSQAKCPPEITGERVVPNDAAVVLKSIRDFENYVPTTKKDVSRETRDATGKKEN